MGIRSQLLTKLNYLHGAGKLLKCVTIRMIMDSSPYKNITTMTTVEEECWHGAVSCREAEERLLAVNMNNAYLFRKSEIKRKGSRGEKFILSYISDKDSGLFKHLVVPGQGRNGFSSVSEAFSVMDRMAVSSDHCSNPVPPSIVNRDNSDMSEDDD